MVVAEIFSVKPHPNADRLKVCSVDLGHDVAQVVTNAANAAAGMKVIFAVQTLALLYAPCVSDRLSTFAWCCSTSGVSALASCAIAECSLKQCSSQSENTSDVWHSQSMMSVSLHSKHALIDAYHPTGLVSAM